jgi:Protein of unknown function (DUF3618)
VRSADRPPSPAELETDIARTRAELGLTVDALVQRLDSGLLLQKGLDMIADRVIGDGEFRLGAAIRANPIPVALIGFGVAWLLAGSTGVVDSVAQDARVRQAGRRIADLAGQVGARVGETVGVTGHPQIDAPDGEPRGNGWVHQASDAARGALRSVRERGGAAIGRAGEYAGEARVSERASEEFQRYPLLFGALAVVAAAAAAALLPSSRVEDALLGETRDNLRAGARALAREAVERVRDIAEGSPR